MTEPTPDIPDEAIEAAARVIAQTAAANGIAALANPSFRQWYLDRAEDALAAAYPVLRAQIEAELRAQWEAELDVERLAGALRVAGVESGSVGGEAYRRYVAGVLAKILLGRSAQTGEPQDE